MCTALNLRSLLEFLCVFKSMGISLDCVKLLFILCSLCSALWLEVETLHNSKRVTVVGCQNGHVKVAVTDLTSGSMLPWKLRLELICVSRLKLYLTE